jgi:hypothetical protein
MAKANLPPERPHSYVVDVLVLAILTVLLLTAAVTGLGVLYGDTASPIEAGPAGQACTRADYEGPAVWIDGASWRCRYLPDSRTFAWGPAGAPTAWEREPSEASAPSASW